MLHSCQATWQYQGCVSPKMVSQQVKERKITEMQSQDGNTGLKNEGRAQVRLCHSLFSTATRTVLFQLQPRKPTLLRAAGWSCRFVGVRDKWHSALKLEEFVPSFVFAPGEAPLQSSLLSQGHQWDVPCQRISFIHKHRCKILQNSRLKSAAKYTRREGNAPSLVGLILVASGWFPADQYNIPFGGREDETTPSSRAKRKTHWVQNPFPLRKSEHKTQQ